MITLNLPYPPTVNSIYQRSKCGGVHLKQNVRNYRQTVRYCVLEQLGLVKPMPGNLEIWVDLSPPDVRKRDIDNVLKALFDSLQCGGVILDDSQFKSLHVRMHAKEKHGKALVSIDLCGVEDGG